MKPEISLTCSQEPTTRPHPDPDKSSSHNPSIQYYTPIYAYVSQVVCSLQIFY
jgi:hypothetical protein